MLLTLLMPPDDKTTFAVAKVSGISNLSFSFRGNHRVREAMHSVFYFRHSPV